ncbi:hypothetical protein C1646_721370 [Rhizophagus diaphanus]|nr:hypothetical protein C1646_721370 [Rhizophagus diaphanus] [Rhizophagus sp. MUCL 43196]
MFKVKNCVIFATYPRSFWLINLNSILAFLLQVYNKIVHVTTKIIGVIWGKKKS